MPTILAVETMDYLVPYRGQSIQQSQKWDTGVNQKPSLIYPIPRPFIDPYLSAAVNPSRQTSGLA